MYNLALLGSDVQKNMLKNLVNRYKSNVTSDGVGKTGPQWGVLRYSASQAFAAALYGALGESTTVDDFIYATIDYIMGANSRTFSFIVGFGENHPKHPHHRNVYLNDNNVSDAQKNNLSIPLRNRQFGYMVGGTLDPNAYSDDANNYEYTEGGIDYNTGLVGALGYIMSRRAPVDTSKFNATPTARMNKIHPIQKPFASLRVHSILHRLSGIAAPHAPVDARLLYTPDGRLVKTCRGNTAQQHIIIIP
jgi:hypothetical protein